MKKHQRIEEAYKVVSQELATVLGWGYTLKEAAQHELSGYDRSTAYTLADYKLTKGKSTIKIELCRHNNKIYLTKSEQTDGNPKYTQYVKEWTFIARGGGRCGTYVIIEASMNEGNIALSKHEQRQKLAEECYYSPVQTWNVPRKERANKYNKNPYAWGNEPQSDVLVSNEKLAAWIRSLDIAGWKSLKADQIVKAKRRKCGSAPVYVITKRAANGTTKRIHIGTCCGKRDVRIY